MMTTIEIIKKEGAIFEEELGMTVGHAIKFRSEVLNENDIARFFSKNDDNDVLVTKDWMNDNGFVEGEMYENDIYERILLKMGRGEE